MAQPGFEPDKSSPLPTQLCFIYAAEFDLTLNWWRVNLYSKEDPFI